MTHQTSPMATRSSSPKRPLQVLMVDDSTVDAALICRELERYGYRPHCQLVNEASTFREALKSRTWDIILSDYELNSFSGLEALKVVKDSGLDLPFIIVSSIMGEDLALEAIRSGAHDYLFKDRLGRLGPAVHKALREAQERRARYHAEEALRRSEENYRLLVKNIPAIVSKGYPDGSADFFDDKITVLTGYPRDDFITRRLKWLDVVEPDDLPQMRRIFLQALKGERSYVREYRVRKKDGGLVWVQERSQIVLGPDGRIDYISGVLFDITESKRQKEIQRQLEAQLRQAHKMEAIGVLAGGIAHDFNNILSAIIGYTELALLALDDNSNREEINAHLHEILRAGGRARDLVNQILTFSRQAEPERKPVQLELIVKEAIKFLRASIPTTIDIHSRITPIQGIVLGDPVQIHQVLINLCTNAYHAMVNGGGVMEVSLQEVRLTPEMAKSHPDLHSGQRYARLTVRDTGHGMDQPTMERIFDPFFTTKKAGEGTGLGLSVVHGIVKSLGGAILVDSILGQGSTFHVFLPVKSPDMKDITPPTESLPGGGEHILYVDDEEQICQIAQRMLEHLGYQVTALSHSVTALQHFQARPASFDLVITDLTMPVMTGLDLAREILKIRRNVPIILTTGFSERVTREMAQALGIREYIMKPIVLRQLSQVIRKVLDEAKSDRTD